MSSLFCSGMNLQFFFQGNGGRLGEACILLLQIVFSILVIAIFVAAIVGLLADVDVSEHCPWCKDVGCLETKWWNCDSAAILPDFCVFNVVNVEGHSNTKIICPSVGVWPNLRTYCFVVCVGYVCTCCDCSMVYNNKVMDVELVKG